MKHLIVIDDTGSPGNFNETRFLKEDRKTLVAVFINQEIRQVLEKILVGIIEILNKEFKINELHFKDLINKNGIYKNLRNDDIIYIIEVISELFANIELPYFVQTCHKKTLEENGLIVESKIVVDNLNLQKNEDNALFLLLIKIKEYLVSNYPNQLVEILMDEGRKKRNTVEKFNLLDGVSVNSEISYKSSEENVLLQVADYFAYGINRIQTSLVKEKRTDLDKTLVELFSFALQNQVSFGVSKIEIDLDNFTKDDYDYHQRTKRQIDGNLDSWRNAQDN